MMPTIVGDVARSSISRTVNKAVHTMVLLLLDVYFSTCLCHNNYVDGRQSRGKLRAGLNLGKRFKQKQRPRDMCGPARGPSPT